MKHLLLTAIAAVVLLGCGPSASERALHKAASDGNIEAVKQHLAAGAEVDAKGGRGLTPLHFAAGFSRGGVGKEIAELLIANGADVNAKDEDGWTPLHWVAYEDQQFNKEVGELLIAKGADMNAVEDHAGWTPLHVAAYNGYKAAVELLVAKGADVNAIDADGKTPLDWAEKELTPEVKAAKKETADLLRKHGGKHGTICGAAGGGDIEAVKEFLAAGVDVNAKDDDGATPLFYASWGDEKEIVELLIAKGADVNAKDVGGSTPLDWATHPDNPHDTAEIADLLRKHGGKTGEELK